MLPLTRQKRYHNFNIFFMLERQLILRTHGGGDEMFDVDINSTLPPDVRCYVDLYLPPLCSRYADLALSPDKWFVQLLAKKDKTRIHAKSHGGDLVPFAELTRIIANNYKEMDNETKAFIDDVAKRLGTCYGIWKTNDTREEEVEKSNPRPQLVENGESKTSKKDVGGNIHIKGNNKKTTSRSSYNNSNQGVQPLIMTPHVTSQGSTSTSQGRSINLGTAINHNSSYQTAFDDYFMAINTQVDSNSNNMNQHPPLRFEHPSSTQISSDLQYHCLPTYITMPPDATTPAPQSSHRETRMAQLQKELVNAMADRYEAEVKISIVRDQIIAEEAHLARIQELQQHEKNDRMRLNILHLLSLRQGREIGTTNGLTTSAAAARRMSPPPFLDMTRRIPEAVVAPPREQLFDQCNPRYSVGVAENSKIEDTTAAARAAGGWVVGKTINGNSSKVEREGLDNDDQALIKRKRVVVSSSTQYNVPPPFIERQRECLLALVNDPQSPTAIVSMTDRRRIWKPSSTYYQSGVQW
jgi:hypothetical protein